MQLIQVELKLVPHSVCIKGNDLNERQLLQAVLKSVPFDVSINGNDDNEVQSPQV